MIRVSQVQFQMTQDELEEAVNTMLPPGFSVSALHVTPLYVLCTLQAKGVKVDVKVEVALDSQSGEVAISFHASKWFVSLDFILSPLLKAVTSEQNGIYAQGANLYIDLNKLLRAYLVANSYSLTLGDGVFSVYAQGVQVNVEPSAAVL